MCMLFSMIVEGVEVRTFCFELACGHHLPGSVEDALPSTIVEGAEVRVSLLD